MDGVRTGDALPRPVGGSEAGPVRGCVVSLSCWLVSPTQFQDPDFGGLSGGRVVRIAVHPDYQGVGDPSSVLSPLCCGLARAGARGCVTGKRVEEHAVRLSSAVECGGWGRTDRMIVRARSSLL